MFGVVISILQRFTNVLFYKDISFAYFLLFLICNSAIYTSLLFSDYKQDMSSKRKAKRILNISYVYKAISIIFMVLVMAGFVGFLFQNFALAEDKTVEQNLKLVRKTSQSGVCVEDALKRVGLLDKLKNKVYTLSGGEQQRVALARLMIKKCDIILADEPTGSLDSKNADAVMDILRSLNAEGKTIILVTHDEKIKKQGKRVIEL